MSGQTQPSVERDPVVAALARYVEALHRLPPAAPGRCAETPWPWRRTNDTIVSIDAKREAGAA